MNVFRMHEDKHFNTIAKKGGRPHSLIKENKAPFCIDLIAGGTGKLRWLYYEPWFLDEKHGLTLPHYNNEAENEWYHDETMRVPAIEKSGPNDGASGLLQSKIYHYALMAGADYMSEEWGHNCSYLNKQTYELSPYGLVKKDFIEFARGYKTVKPHIPFAIVLPLNYKCIQI